MTHPEGSPESSRARIVALALAAVTIAVFARVLRNGFVSFDDELYVLGNPHVRSGLSFANAAWAMTATEAANWHPLAWISHMLDVSLFGLSPVGHHATSLVLHVANVLLVFFLLRAATGKIARSAVVAALFALHPLRVESVAWVAERKDVLSVFFGLLAIAAWATWTRERARSGTGPSRYGGAYAAALALFAASLMAKSTLVTLPLLLLVLDFWPLGRLPRFPTSATSLVDPPERLSRLLLEKIPFAVLAFGASVLTYRAQHQGGATEALSLSLATRLGNALVSSVVYLGKMAWPSRLAVLYPHPGAVSGWVAAGAALVLAAVTAAGLALARRRPYLIAGWAWYLAALLPVIGIVQVGWQGLADRYTYVPALGIAAAVVWFIADAASGRVPLRVLQAAAALLLAALSAVTVRQIGMWHDSLRLYEHAVAVTGPNETMQIDLGNELARRGRTEEASRHFAEALRIVPGSQDALYALGSLAVRDGKLDQAVTFFSDAARRHPGFAQAHVELASVLIRQNRPAEALPETARALAIRPGLPEALYVEAVALDSLARPDEAEAKYRAAIAGKPGYAEAHQNLGELLEGRGHDAEAAAEYEAALAANPDFAEARQAIENLKHKAASAVPRLPGVTPARGRS